MVASVGHSDMVSFLILESDVANKVVVSDFTIFGDGRLLDWKYGACALDAFRSK